MLCISKKKSSGDLGAFVKRKISWQSRHKLLVPRMINRCIVRVKGKCEG